MEKSDKKDKKAEKQKKNDEKYAKAFAKKQDAYKGGKSEPEELLKILLKDPPFKGSDLSLKQDTFMMILKTLSKMKISQMKKLVETLGEDLAIDLLKY
jgi:hypothetical protein